MNKKNLQEMENMKTLLLCGGEELGFIHLQKNT